MKASICRGLSHDTLLIPFSCTPPEEGVEGSWGRERCWQRCEENLGGQQATLIFLFLAMLLITI